MLPRPLSPTGSAYVVVEMDHARNLLAFRATCEGPVSWVWTALRFDAEGRLPEQVSDAPLDPSYVQEWIDRWGPVARPLLWSHATYLGLRAALGGRRFSR